MKTQTKNHKVKSAIFYDKNYDIIKIWTFDKPVRLDSDDFNEVTPIEGYNCVIICGANQVEHSILAENVPYTYPNINQ